MFYHATGAASLAVAGYIHQSSICFHDTKATTPAIPPHLPVASYPPIRGPRTAPTKNIHLQYQRPTSPNQTQLPCTAPHLPSLASEAHCRIRALSSLSALSTPESEDPVDQEASLRGGRSLSDPMEGFRLCLLRPRRLLDLEEGVGGFTKCASNACGGWAQFELCTELLTTFGLLNSKKSLPTIHKLSRNAKAWKPRGHTAPSPGNEPLSSPRKVQLYGWLRCPLVCFSLVTTGRDRTQACSCSICRIFPSLRCFCLATIGRYMIQQSAPYCLPSCI